ncbi:MAG: CBS domain-containing protein [Microbacteriaceae bacterium]|nr:CBS domain-containing protein [Burkholderiaceae bacterium]
MFTVYGLNGRIYSGPLEGLRALGPVQAVARLRAVEPITGSPGDDLVEPAPGVIVAGPKPDVAAGLGQPELIPREALAAYAQAQSSADAAPRQLIDSVASLMSESVITVPLAANVSQAMALLAAARLGQPPVVDGQNRLVGLVLRSELLPGPADIVSTDTWDIWLLGPVAERMWTPVPSVQPDTPIRQLAQVLLDLRLPGLPVVDAAGTLVGFVSRSDVLKALTREPPVDLWR